jgi:hypothetical protein
MATTINDALSAIDDYMSKNGKGQSYLAKKFIDLFESKNSPLNVVDGPMKLVSDKFNKLGKKVDDLTLSVGSFNTKVRILMAAIKPSTFNKLNTAAEDLTKRLNNYVLKFPKVGAGTRNRTPTIPKTLLDNVNKIRINTNGLLMTNKLLRNIERLLRDSLQEKALQSNSTQPSQINKKMVLNLFSNNTNNSANNLGDDKKSGIFGKMFKYAMLGTGVYLLGKFKKYLDETATGRAIQSILSGTFQSILTSITDFVKSEETWKTFGRSALFIIDGIKAISDNIFKYVVEPIADKVKTTDWGKVANYMGDKVIWVSKNILEPIFTSIGESMKKDFEKGEYGSLGVKILGSAGILSLLKFVPGIGLALRGISTIFKGSWKILSGLFSILGKLPLGTAASFVQGIKTFGLAVGRFSIIGGIISGIAYTLYKIPGILKEFPLMMNDVIDLFTTSKEMLAKNNASMSNAIKKSISTQDEIIKNLEEKKRNVGLSWKEENELAIARYKKDISNINNERSVINKRSGDQGFLGSIIGNPSQKLRDQRLKELQDREISTAKAINILTNANKTKVQDAEIIIPNKKDAHIFAKGGGPFDQALKDVNKKIDTIVAVLSNGFSGLAAVTAQSSGNVAQAVIASAGASKQPHPTIIGGSNPIQRHRINTGRHIEFGQ